MSHDSEVEELIDLVALIHSRSENQLICGGTPLYFTNLYLLGVHDVDREVEGSQHDIAVSIAVVRHL